MFGSGPEPADDPHGTSCVSAIGPWGRSSICGEMSSWKEGETVDQVTTQAFEVARSTPSTDAPSSAAPSRFRWISLFETLAALGILQLVNMAFFADAPAYVALHPHPYFAIILLVSLRYARLESLIATLMVAAALFAQVRLDDRILYSSVETEVVNKIVLFFVLNLILGELGSLFHNEIEEARKELAESRDRFEQLMVQYNALSMVKDELSERIVGQTTSIVSLYEAAKRLETLDLQELYSTLLAITVKFIGAERCSIHVVDAAKGELVRAHVFGWSREEQEDETHLRLPLDHGLIGHVARSGRMVTLRDLSEDRNLARLQEEASLHTILAAPLVVENEVRAVLNVSQLPFLKFTPTTIRLFYLIADLGSTALLHNDRFAKMQDASILDPETGLHTLAFLDSRLREEMQRFKRTQLPFGVAVMRIDHQKAIRKHLGKDGMRALHRRMGELLVRNKRDIDVVALSEDRQEFLFVLPITEIEGVLAFAKKVQESVVHRLSIKKDERLLRPSASFGCTVATGRIAEGQALIDLAREALDKSSDEEKGRVEVRVERGESRA